MLKRVKAWSVKGLVLIIIMLYPVSAFADSASLKEGIEQYKKENYEEAIELLKKAMQEEPESSTAAFFLGMAYKQILAYEKSAEFLKTAVTMRPGIKEALVELIEVLHLSGRGEDAKEWIRTAEEEGISPAKIAFLKGLVLQKEGRSLEAVESFEKAKSIDSGIAQAADVQIALCYLKERKLDKAHERFLSAIQHDPTSDLANFARRYEDLVEKRMFLERPFRFTVGVFGQYDTNVVLKPMEASLASDITDEESYGTTNAFRMDYVPILEGPWLFNAQYSLLGNFYEKHSTTHNVLSNGFYVAPGYNFGTYALNLAAGYNHILVRGTSYKRYSDSLSLGPLFRMLAGRNNIIELYGGYNRKEYFQPPLDPDEDRDSSSFESYASWIWLFKEGAFSNLKYELSSVNADGRNWENYGEKLSWSATYPLIEKVKLQVSGQAFFQTYTNTHTYADADPMFDKKREDENYQGSLGLTWDVIENGSLLVQYTKSRADSNVAIYDYTRELYTVGVEYKF